MDWLPPPPPPLPVPQVNKPFPFPRIVSMTKSCTEALRASVHHLTLNIYKTSNVYFTTQTTTLT
ncbi:hypothetical protein TVAG_340020 [Trichomonas vaginalis G3]|uniref:Uncharacterized protein n=1 Tax=Trichomonas vaginalis (strain ATCC PRA-98 / G3) TaxID=412133 RepID=A2GL03_TRIV3|nr:galactokinase protein [Trichomonas vaginalis G3]EAX82165.1 hypothetical protein TVAG_340020 [Trichomonas vaginalis G3]KAI5520704.1 galactokinase protein [Trichomonas vaginalis G3]|eukprot:XP_001295095.1 hypothetical protein [Trichomonas vaginalis G3]